MNQEQNQIKTKIFELIKNHALTAEQGMQLLNGLSTPVVPRQDIAVIGMSGKFPDADNIDEYWQNLVNGKDSVRPVPKERWDIDTFYDPDPQKPNKTYCKWGGFLSDIDCFDSAFFRISPREAELMDPQQRLFLQECWTAIEDAGYSPMNLDGKKCGVFVGGVTGDYLNLIREQNLSAEGHFFLGNVASILASRISYHLNLKGPAVALETACSSSLVAVHLACESIRSGTSELALAGGVSIFTTPEFYIWSSRAGMLSPQGKCRTFDNNADGMVIGEAVGVVVLKSLSLAQRDGDHIYGIIKGSGINQDGQTNGITVPNASAQTELECQVYDQYQIKPETITYVESHGTGTKLGDPIEVEALTNAFGRYTNKKQFCALGSVKTNIGHTQMAAGIVSFIKALLCLKYQKLVPSLHLEQENDHINFKNSPFYVSKALEDWKTENGIPRRAAVSSFGVSGTNAHAVIEEFIPPINQTITNITSNTSYLMVFSAKNEEALYTYSKKMSDFLERHQSLSLVDIAYTLQTGREAMDVRLAIKVSTIEELKSKLEQFSQRQTEIKDLYHGQIQRKQEQKSLLLEGREGQEFLRIILEDKKLDKLAQLWVTGEAIDWDLLYLDQKPKRLSLPTYAFAKDRYWIPVNENNTTEIQTTLTVNKTDDEKKQIEFNKTNQGPIPAITETKYHSYLLQITTDTTCSNKQKEFINQFIKKYENKTKNSKDSVIRYRPVLADQRTSVYFNAILKEIHYTITYQKASGAYLYDIDGNQYIDISGDFGVNFFGHQPSFVNDAVKKQLDQGISLSGRYDALGKAAEIFCELTGHDRIFFCQSGSEALMSALRLARAYTARNKFVMFKNSYHGIVDCFLGGVWPGLVESSVAEQLLLEYGESESLEIISKQASELAAIIVEPVQSAHLDLQPAAFLKSLRKLASQKGIVLIFDEMISGFRVDVKGAQGFFGIQADLATYGKILGGGITAGAVAGHKDIMKWVDGGVWNYGDTSKPAPITQVAGTHTQNPAKMAATLAILEELKKQSPDVQKRLTEKTQRIKTQINQYTKQNHIPMEIISFGSIFRFKFGLNQLTLTQVLFLNLLNYHGIRYNLHGNCFLTTAHSDKDIKAIIEAIQKSLEILLNEGFFLSINKSTS
jgi:glutamate-1-semialdehyde aminotransferase/3-oxoacyl-(acyl-carrier-protein) synthase